MRSWWDQVTISWAATIGPMPGSSRNSGTSARTWLRISRSSVSASAVAVWMRRASVRSTRIVASCAGVRGAGAAEAAAAVEQLAERQPTQLVAELVGGGDDHAAQLHKRDLARVDRGSPGQQQKPQRLLMLAGSRPCPTLVCERRAGCTDCVELVVFAAQPPLAAAGAVDLMHLFALPLQVPDKSGAVVAGALDRPESIAGRVPICEADGVRVAACAGGRRHLRDHRAGMRVDDRERVLVAMGIDADHVVHLLCKHSIDPPTRRVRYAGLEQGNRAAGL